MAFLLRIATLPLFAAADEDTPAAIEQPKSSKIEDVDQGQDVPARTVFFELNPSKGATKYTVQVRALTQHWPEPYTSILEKTTLRLRLTPGQYELRTRSLDEHGAPGRWSRWTNFWVRFRSPDKVIPADNSTLSPKSDKMERVIFEWPLVHSARYYLFSLYDDKGKLIQHARTEKPWIGQNLNLNTSYSWTIAPQLSKTEPEPPKQSLSLHSFSIGTPEPLLRGIQVEVEKPSAHAVSYDFEFVKLLENNQASEPTIYNSKEDHYHVALAPGEYEMRVRTNQEGGGKSSWSAPNHFFIATFAPKHVSPAPTEVVESTDDLNSEVRLEWKPSLNAKRYHVMVWDEGGKQVANEWTEEKFLVVRLPHEHKYTWSVLAYQRREQAPPHPVVDPANVTAFEINNYQKLDMNAAEEPSQFYVWGRYLHSDTTYKASNYDNNTQINQTVYNGLEEFAIGYWHRKTNLGVLLTYAAEGFYIQHKLFFYSAGSLLLGYRMLNDDHSRWRFFAGAAYDEMPEILDNPITRELYFDRIVAYSPMVRVTYAGEFNPRYGYQFYGSYFTASSAIRTPDNTALHEMSQLNLGIYGTYKLESGNLVMVGYSYQIDSYAYQSEDTITHGINTGQYAGHYLSVFLEFAASRSQR